MLSIAYGKHTSKSDLVIPSTPGVLEPAEAVRRAASSSQVILAINRNKRSIRRNLSVAVHIANLRCISQIIKGLHLVRSVNLQHKSAKLFPFAM